MAPTDVFFSTPGRLLTGVTAVAALVLVAGLAGDVPATDLVLAAALAALAVLTVWVVLGRPAVEVSDGTVVLRNVLRTVTIPWPTVRGTEVGWSLVVHTTAGRWTAWAAPRESGTARAMRRRRGDAAVATTGPGDAALPTAPQVGGADGRTVDASGRRRHAAGAEAVAAAIDGRLEALRRAGHLEGADRAVVEHGVRPTVTWHRTTIVSALALAVVAVGTRLL